jgi:non-specific serine/threonine protein kinase/serine/threonine-protein kinase
MNSQEWQQVRSLLESALEVDAPDRSRFLDQACGGADTRLEVESLLELHEQAGTDFLNTPAIAGVVAEGAAQFHLRPGQLIGSYEIIEEIAQGGMGAVYRAKRADGQYAQEVALKIVRSGFGTELIAARFRNERQILASLDHPNIAKLLDGGTTPDGLPYFVMELIGGLPITEYCDQHRLSINSRLQLFRRVCAAVHYAHQQLVIHRDVKPTNVLVADDGTPKLLDFGIAKVLDRSQRPQNLTMTVAGLWMMTPEYASPEQIRGEPVTTATDIYSLGLVLYELLAGRPAYRSAGQSPQEIAQVVCEAEPQRPSLAIQTKAKPSANAGESHKGEAIDVCSARDTSLHKLRKRLQGDLDNIVLMALRKEPGRRYASVEQFAEDIRRDLDNIPVVAHQDSLWYRASKFVSRHRAGVAASVVMLLVLVAGLAATFYEARVAQQQAEIARQQRIRAEQRFNDVRKLANSLMFDIHDSIRNLPGATPARKLVINRALEYLDSLSQEANGDLSLQRELAAAYDRVGDLLGYNGAANLGDLAGARQSFLKALSIREAAATANPDELQAQLDLMNDYFRLAFVLDDAGEYKAALDCLRKQLPIAQKLAVSHKEPKYQDWLAGVYWQSGNISLQAGDNVQALENFRQSIAIRKPIAVDPHADPVFRTHFAGDYIGLGRALAGTGDIDGAIESTKNGVQELELLSHTDPNNATLREYLGEAYDNYASFLAKKGDLEQALINGQKSYRVFQELHSTDPTNALARDNMALTSLRVGDILELQGKPHEAQSYVRNSIALFESINPKNRYLLDGLTSSYATLARTYVSLSRSDSFQEKKTDHLLEAQSWFQKSLRAYRQNPAAAHPSPEAPQVDQIERDLAKCEEDLTKLRASKKRNERNP